MIDRGSEKRKRKLVSWYLNFRVRVFMKSALTCNRPMADKESNGERQDFTQAWKFSDVVLLVEGEKLHVHRAVLAMCSPVFEKMFTSEFQEKEKKEIFLLGKKANEVKELLQVIYPSVERKPLDEIKEENCHLLLSLAHEYQMAAITQRCEDFIVKIMKESFSSDIIAELVFAQTYNLKKLKQASIELLAQRLTLPELKKQKGYDEILPENLQESMERMITRLLSQLTDTQNKLHYICKK